MPIVIHDSETTGTDKKFGQITEFYGARVVRDSFAPGSDLRITEGIGKDRPSIHCSLRPHACYDPEAFMITGADLEAIRPRYNRPVPLAQIPLTDRLYTNYEMHRAIDDFIWRHSKHTRMYKGGYNSGQFDNRFLEQGRFQNLLPNSDAADFRVDVDFLKFARAASHVYPDRFVVPASPHDPDKRTFRQGSFAPANGIDFDEAKAHGAWYDVVKGTFEIARLVKAKAGPVWDIMMRHADIGAMRRMLKTNEGRIYYYVDTKFNQLKAEPVIVFWPMPRPDSHHPRPQVLAFSLAHAPGQFLRRTSEEGLTALIENASFRPDDNNPLRVIDLRDNPLLVPLDDFEKLFGVSPHIDASVLATSEYRANQLRDASEFIETKLRPAAEKWERPSRLKPGDPAEDFIYGDQGAFRLPTTDFAKRMRRQMRERDNDLLFQFHHEASDWEERAAIMRKLDNPIHQELALRLVGEHDFGALLPSEQQDYMDFLHDRLMGPESRPWPSLDATAAKIEAKLAGDLPEEQRIKYTAMLQAHNRWREDYLDFREQWGANKIRPSGPRQKETFAVQVPRGRAATLVF